MASERLEIAIGVLVRAGRVLVCRRRDGEILGGHWEFPGGKLEAGETPAMAVIRELREELGIDADVMARLTPIEHDYPHARVRLYPFLCRPGLGEPRPLASQALDWVAPASLRHLRFPPANTALIEEVIARLSNPPSAS